MQLNSSSRAVFVDESKWLCPSGYKSVAQGLDGTGKEWSQPHPDGNRTLQQCADICSDRSGCTSFEYANGPDHHGACGTYTGGDSNLGQDKGADLAGSNWYSCVKCESEDDNSDSYILVVGGNEGGQGFLDTVEVVSPNPTSNPIPACINVLGNFPTQIQEAVGTTFGKLKRALHVPRIQVI